MAARLSGGMMRALVLGALVAAPGCEDSRFHDPDEDGLLLSPVPTGWFTMQFPDAGGVDGLLVLHLREDRPGAFDLALSPTGTAGHVQGSVVLDVVQLEQFAAGESVVFDGELPTLAYGEAEAPADGGLNLSRLILRHVRSMQITESWPDGDMKAIELRLAEPLDPGRVPEGYEGPVEVPAQGALLVRCILEGGELDLGFTSPFCSSVLEDAPSLPSIVTTLD